MKRCTNLPIKLSGKSFLTRKERTFLSHREKKKISFVGYTGTIKAGKERVELAEKGFLLRRS